MSSLSEASTSLSDVRIEYMFAASQDTMQQTVVHWSAYTSDVGTPNELCTWTPSPTLRSRLTIWFEKFRTAECVLLEMERRWCHRLAREDNIPSLESLQFYRAHYL